MCRETPINTDWEQGLTKERPTLVANQREEKNKIKRIKIKTAKLAIMGADQWRHHYKETAIDVGTVWLIVCTCGLVLIRSVDAVSGGSGSLLTK